mmetsp:Transcript_17582/g.33353  ORF Transcript_17582/g.33353 Transcript_17582/m.33353 type:complete len:201 (+) Transcript_17582:682-1284(+)
MTRTTGPSIGLNIIAKVSFSIIWNFFIHNTFILNKVTTCTQSKGSIMSMSKVTLVPTSILQKSQRQRTEISSTLIIKCTHKLRKPRSFIKMAPNTIRTRWLILQPRPLQSLTIKMIPRNLRHRRKDYLIVPPLKFIQTILYRVQTKLDCVLTSQCHIPRFLSCHTWYIGRDVKFRPPIPWSEWLTRHRIAKIFVQITIES